MTTKDDWLGRVNNGYRNNGVGKIPEETVREIRRSKMSIKWLMKEYDIKRSKIIEQILNYETYQDVF